MQHVMSGGGDNNKTRHVDVMTGVSAHACILEDLTSTRQDLILFFSNRSHATEVFWEAFSGVLVAICRPLLDGCVDLFEYSCVIIHTDTQTQRHVFF